MIFAIFNLYVCFWFICDFFPFFNRINATYDQIYHGYLVNMYKLSNKIVIGEVWLLFDIDEILRMNLEITWIFDLPNLI